MVKIKIISNPYLKCTMFQSWSKIDGVWVDINQENNTNSGLLKANLCNGFFPFKVRQIVDILIDEYGSSTGKVEMVFEGTDDEYKELESICVGEGYSDKVSVSKSERYLENARDILPDIIEVFKELKPLVAESVSNKEKIKKELEKFSDASNDIIPICVIGNYSSGKSTFINALIGYELLPSSDEPTTAKIFKISRSKHNDRASVKFECYGKTVRLRFRADSFEFGAQDETPLTQKIRQLLNGIAGDSIPKKLNRTLDAINSYVNSVADDSISDLIEVEAPFDEDGLWGKIWSNFVIFDTPGSNSASNLKHYKVLKKAMADLSNGLPIFVSEFDSLDSTDNDKLYQDINNMEELDNRFTMIIVNKADAASLKKSGYTEEDRDRILSLAIPRKLYSGGIYYVSSIMGLGSKNDEDFINDHNAEVFEDQRTKYLDSGSRFYKTLYRYNIMPAQIKKKYDDRSGRHQNLIYVNSGLYTIEQAIETFAAVYSHYNKCQQSQLFLGKVIRITSDEIVEAKRRKEEYKERIYANLEKEKAVLLERIDQESIANEGRFIKAYSDYMKAPIQKSKVTCTPDELKEQEEKLLQYKSEEKDVKGKERGVRDARQALYRGTANKVLDVIKQGTLSNISKIGAEFSQGIKDINDDIDELKETRRDVGKESSDELIDAIKERFIVNWTEARTLLETKSREYWACRTEEFKKSLIAIVTNSTALNEERRVKLAGIIIEYQELVFEISTERIFNKTEFLHWIFGDSNKLQINKLALRYNTSMDSEVTKIFADFGNSHVNSFKSWMNCLLTIIRDNIVELNPELHNQSEIIAEETARIAELEVRMQRLNDYTMQIRQMMAWKEV